MQSDFLRASNIHCEVALIAHNLAPLESRRDMAMLGIIHRAALRWGTIHVHEYFRRLPSSTLLEFRHGAAPYTSAFRPRAITLLTNTILGLIPVYNRLQEDWRRASSVSDFQSCLAEEVRSLHRIGVNVWAATFCPRRLARDLDAVR